VVPTEGQAVIVIALQYADRGWPVLPCKDKYWSLVVSMLQPAISRRSNDGDTRGRKPFFSQLVRKVHMSDNTLRPISQLPIHSSPSRCARSTLSPAAPQKKKTPLERAG
jgi:hypothetical protein